MPLAQRLRHWGRTDPDRVACAVGDEQASYGDLLGACAALPGLIGVGREPRARFGTRPLVAVSIPNSVPFVRCFVAAACSDAVVAVFDPSWSGVQLTAALELLDPDVVLTEDPAVAALGARTLAPDALPGEPGPGPPPRDPDESFLIGFTSGTSSRPKAFVRTRRSWRDSLERSAELFAARPDSVTLAPGPLAHGLSLYALVESLFTGGTFVSTQRFRLPAIAAAARRHRPTRFVGVPTMYRRVLADTATRAAVSTVRTFVSSGSKMSAATVRDVFAAAPDGVLLEYYGASELSFVSVRRVTADDLADDAADDGAPANVGRPFPGVEIQVRGPDGQALPASQVGTVFVRSALVSQGYVTPEPGRLRARPSAEPGRLRARPSAEPGRVRARPSAEPTGFRRDGEWCTVGDTGFLRGDDLHVLGREGEMVIVGGNNIYPSEVEAVLRTYPGVSDGYVLAVEEPGRGEVLVAALGARDSAALDFTALRDHLSARLPRYEVPRQVVVIGEWPMTSSGKVNKRDLRTAVEHRLDRVLRVIDWR